MILWIVKSSEGSPHWTALLMTPLSVLSYFQSFFTFICVKNDYKFGCHVKMVQVDVSLLPRRCQDSVPHKMMTGKKSKLCIKNVRLVSKVWFKLWRFFDFSSLPIVNLFDIRDVSDVKKKPILRLRCNTSFLLFSVYFPMHSSHTMMCAFESLCLKWCFHPNVVSFDVPMRIRNLSTICKCSSENLGEIRVNSWILLWISNSWNPVKLNWTTRLSRLLLFLS